MSFRKSQEGYTHDPDQASEADLPAAVAPDSNGAARPHADLPGEASAAHAPMPALAQNGAPPNVLDDIAASLKRLDERVGRIETQVQPRFLPQRPADPSAVPWPRLPEQIWFLALALATAATVLLVRLFQLDQLQNEIYGDISIVYEYIADIQAGKWPTYFSLSSGPLYHYLIMPIIALTGPTYFGIKLASVVVSLGVLAATYALARRLIDDRFALLALFIAGVSSWLLIFSRLGNSQILVPLLTTCALWLMLRAAQAGRLADIAACAAVSALGLYVYPQSFVLAPVIGFTLLCLRWAGLPVKWADLGRFALVATICALPFVFIVAHDPANFFSGYIGGKLEGGTDPLRALWLSVTRTLLAMHVRGDAGFRSNPIQLPHLDWISGALLLVGVVYWLQPARRRLSPALLVPLILLQVPAMLVLKEANDSPSASRTLGVAPIAYILAASGLWWLLQLIRAPRQRWLRAAIAGVLLAAILLINAQRYFQTYIAGLPYQNTPMARIITTYLDSLPPDTQMYLVGCCWEASMPEPKSIQYAMARPDHLKLVMEDELSCPMLQSIPAPAVFVWSFHAPLPAATLESCRAWLPAQMYGSIEGRPVFYAAPLQRDQSPGTEPAPDQPQANEQLESSAGNLDGQPIEVWHSPLDMGSVPDLFDNDPATLIRGRDANPFVLKLDFGQPRDVAALGLNLATIPRFQIKVDLVYQDGMTTSTTQDYQDLPADPHVDLPIASGSQPVRSLRIEIYNQQPPSGESPHIHVRDIQVR